MRQFGGESAQYVQINDGLVSQPDPSAFPPVTERVGQEPDPFKADFADYGTLRTTVQWIDNCNLRCPGCYAKSYLPHGRELGVIANSRTVTPFTDFEDQIAAHGPQLSEVYFIGLEPTINPAETRRMMAATHAAGLTSVAATNGAYPVGRFEDTFREALDTGKLHRINISLDSIVPAIHNRLRGRKYAYDRTLAVIRHAVEQGVPFQVTSTVWADNYHTIVDSARELYEMGVRGFAFHEGSLEGVSDHQSTATRRISPLAWRALTTQLEALKDEFVARGELTYFIFPYIYFTEKELRNGVIGDRGLTERYLEHVGKVENGEGSRLPFIACPAVDVPQVYMFGNDGPESQGAISVCNMHSIQTGTYLAHFDGETRRFLPVLDPDKNQIYQMASSPNLCPARPRVTRDGNPSDRYSTEEGDVFHACRYISNNQFPFAEKQFGAGQYDTIAAYYRERWNQLQSSARTLGDIDAIEAATPDYANRLTMLQSGA